LWCIDSLVLRNPPLRQAPKRYRAFKKQENMKRILQILILIFSTVGCSNKQDNLIGKWQEYTTGVNGEFKIVDAGYDKYFVIGKSNNDLTIFTDYGGKYDNDTCDNVFFDGNELTFRKHNEDGSFNHYKLQFGEKQLLLQGEEKSWNGSTYNVKYKKVKQ
jgi:hypothetical protein